MTSEVKEIIKETAVVFLMAFAMVVLIKAIGMPDAWQTSCVSYEAVPTYKWVYPDGSYGQTYEQGKCLEYK